MIILEKHTKGPLRTAVFDFDGTLSTLRCGWESVMEPMMVEYIAGERPTQEIRATVRDYIDASTGIQTIEQMKWLAKTVAEYGQNPQAPTDPWEYKSEYNRRLMETVEKRRRQAAEGEKEAFLMANCKAFLQGLKERGFRLFAASGTDEADVREEAAVLGLAGYFEEIAGARPFSEGCSKEATLRRLIEESGAANAGLLVVGDGPVEIRLGRQHGALTLGIAGNERERRGFDEAKQKRLTAAGAHALVDCFADTAAIFNWMGV